ncbi:8-oxo-dGTP diphosphatase [Candidatus Nomurabacteria bacterium]|nr:8-oxo-dGTP diphosphatase [Candidatus Nomurabacteria bacterium]
MEPKREDFRTLAFLIKDDKILLAFKKRGFGQGFYNGFGGKLEPEETIEQAAGRELNEESGLKAEKLEKRAIIHFNFPDTSLIKTLVIHVFKVIAWSGELVETEEMKPQWFDLQDIPYQQMWDDDQYWLPLFLDNKKLKASFIFDQRQKVKEQKIELMNELE